MKPLNDVEKLVKPSMLTLIIVTLVSLAPYGNLVLKIVEKDYNNLLLMTLLIFPSLIFMTVYWCWHIYSLIRYKKIAKDIIENFDKN